jgi:hypothetical protein
MTPAAVVFAVLSLLAYLLVACVLRILGSRLHNELEKHRLVVASNQRRLDYLQSVHDRQAWDEAKNQR